MQSKFLFNGSGGVKLLSAPSRNYNASLDFGKIFTHLIYGTGSSDINVKLNSEWLVSAGKFYWYRVLFYCQSPNWSSSSAIDDTYQISNDEGFFAPDPEFSSSNSHCKRIRMKTAPMRLSGFALVSTSIVDENDDATGTTTTTFETKNSTSECDKLQGETISISCAKKKPVIMVVVSARNLSEVCDKLKKPRFGPPINFRICSIKKFITPINESSGKGIQAELQDQDFSNVPECLDYNLDFDFTKQITNKNLFNNPFVFHNFVYRSFYSESKINIRSSGTADFQYSPVSSEDFIILYSANSTVSYSSFVYPEPDDSVLSFAKLTKEPIYNGSSILYGESDFVISPLIRNFLGKLEVGGSLDDFVSPERKYKFSLNLNLVSKSKFSFSLNTNSYCFIDFSGNANFRLVNKFKYESLGRIIASGSAELISNNYSYEANGSINLSLEKADIVSGSRYYLAQGGITVIGSPGRLGRCFENISTDPPIIHISGSSKSSFVYGFRSNGSIGLGGTTADVISMNRSYLSKDNNIYLSGDSEINFTNFGLLVANAYFYSNYSNAAIETLNDSKISNLPLPSETIGSCGCSSGLTIDLSHNMNNGGPIADFLKNNNNFNFNSQVALRYRAKNNSWLNTQTLTGRDSSFQFIFEVSCTNIVENQTFDEKYFKFNFYAKYKKLNSNSIANLIVYLNPNSICSRNGNVTASIVRSYNPDINEYSILVNSVPTDSYKFFDNIGIFSSNYWNNKFNYSRLRPQYYPSSESFGSPKNIGIWPEFRLNFNENFANDTRTIVLENM